MLPGLVVSIPSGILGRRFGDKNVVLSGLALMAVGGGISGIAETFWMILTGRVLSGIGGVFLFVLMTKMLTDWFADKELYLGMAIFIIGWPIGIAAAQATQGHLAELQSWNVVFISSAVLVLIAFSLMALFYLPPSEQSQSKQLLCAKGTAMSEHTGFQFTDDAVPRAYEEVLVPRLFEPWALLLLDEFRVLVRPPNFSKQFESFAAPKRVRFCSNHSNK